MNEENIQQERELTPEERLEQSKQLLWSTTADNIRAKGNEHTYMRLAEICAVLELEKDVVKKLMDEMAGQEAYKDICVYKGVDDWCYYTYPKIAHNFVRNCALAEENDITRIIAEVVRYESKTYPRATCITAFAQFPYHYTAVQVKNALAKMSTKPGFEDLKTYISQIEKKLYIYSTQYLSQKRAEALVDISEDKRSML